MGKPLTTKTIENARTEAVRREIADGACKGLYLLVTPTGHKSWTVRYRHAGKSRKLTLPGFPSLADARKQASAALADVARGVDPGMAKQAAAKLEANKGRDTFAALSQAFLDRHGRNLRSATLAQYRYALSLASEAWADKTVHDIRRRDVREFLNGIAKDTPVMANRTLGALHKFYKWLAHEDIVENNPASGLDRPGGKETPRDRVLSADEIRRLWNACDEVGPTGAFVKLLLLTGQRRGEVQGMRLSEIQGDTWLLPATRVKNKRQHTVQLSTQAMVILENIEPFNGERFFSPSGNVLARDKKLLDKALKPDAHWTYHDLRRTCVTGLAELGFDRDLIELIVNHVSGSRAGVAGIYNRSQKIAERRAALQRWADHIDQIVTGETAAVLPFGRRS
jgi:integrase